MIIVIASIRRLFDRARAEWIWCDIMVGEKSLVGI